MAIWYALIALIVMVAISVIIFAYFLHDIKKQKKNEGQKMKKATKKGGLKIGIRDLVKYIKSKS